MLTLRGPQGLMRRAFARPYVVVGRAPGNDLTLDHPAVSRRHAYLQLIGDQLFAIDLASRTGSYWPDGARPMSWIDPSMTLRIGPYRLGRWGRGSEEEAPEEPRVSPTARPPEPIGPPLTLEFLDPTAEPPSWRLEPALVLLGTSPACKIQLSGPGVSRFHASLVQTPEGVWAVDLLGRGGLLVNGIPTRSVRLNHGDTIQVGPHRIRLRDETWPGPTSGGTLPAVIEAETWLMPRVSSADHYPGPDALVVPLVRELGRLQQEMADQFQQGLAMMFRLFSGMHQEQMSLVREELAEIRRLAEEQRALRAALDRDRAAPPPSSYRPIAESAPPRPRRPHPHPPRPGGDEAHAALAHRLRELQEEQQGRWQKLLRSVMGDR